MSDLQEAMESEAERRYPSMGGIYSAAAPHCRRKGFIQGAEFGIGEAIRLAREHAIAADRRAEDFNEHGETDMDRKERYVAKRFRVFADSLEGALNERECKCEVPDFWGYAGRPLTWRCQKCEGRPSVDNQIQVRFINRDDL